MITGSDYLGVTMAQIKVNLERIIEENTSQPKDGLELIFNIIQQNRDVGTLQSYLGS